MGCQGMSNILYENGFPVYATVNGKMVEVQEVRRGRWEAIDRDCRGYAITYECSSCKQLITLPYPMKWMDYDYCPNCGAKMDEEEE